MIEWVIAFDLFYFLNLLNMVVEVVYAFDSEVLMLENFLCNVIEWSLSSDWLIALVCETMSTIYS
jgi:hypothetical protein